MLCVRTVWQMYLSDQLTQQWTKLDNRVRFVLAVTRKEVIPSEHHEESLRSRLRADGYYDFQNMDYLAKIGMFALTKDATKRLESAAAQELASRTELASSPSIAKTNAPNFFLTEPGTRELHFCLSDAA